MFIYLFPFQPSSGSSHRCIGAIVFLDGCFFTPQKCQDFVTSLVEIKINQNGQNMRWIFVFVFSPGVLNLFWGEKNPLRLYQLNIKLLFFYYYFRKKFVSSQC